MLRGVTHMRNPLRPGNRLPPEIIVLCAAFIPHTDPKPIVSLTHVCRYWRGAITSSPGNWTLIGSRWKRLVPLCLERAGVAPLTVDISMTRLEQGDNFVQALLPHVSRISNLSLTGYPSLENAANILSSPMLNLTSLKFKSPNWTKIRLSPVLSNIKSLVQLEFIRCEFSFRGFIGFLESNPHLEILDLDISFSATTPVLERGVSLPRLRRLALTCNPTDARALFSSLLLPRGINIEVHGRSSSDGLTSYLPCPSTLIEDLLAPIPTIKYLRNNGQMHLSGNNGSFSFYSHAMPQKVYEELDLFATGAVRELHLHFYSEDPLSLLLERLPALEAFAIYRASCSQSLSALGGEPPLCPSLKTIAFLDCWRLPIDQLEGVLAEREHSIAARLHRVVIAIDKGDFPKYDLVTRLRKLGPRVDFMMGSKLPDLL